MHPPRLTFRILNVDGLPNGGPLSCSTQGQDIEIGRNDEMDWTLPDRNVSRRHLCVNWKDESYWLQDVSSGGTFVNGAPVRLAGPHRLEHGDRIQIGRYIILAEISPPPAPGFPPMPPAVLASGLSIGEPRPLPPPDPPPGRPQGSGPPWSDLQSAPESGLQSGLQSGPPRPDSSVWGIFGGAPGVPTPPVEAGQSGLGSAPAPVAVPPPPPPAPPQNPGTDVFLEALCQGMGLPPQSLGGRDPEALGQEIGQALRLMTQQVMALLAGRAAAKQFLKSGRRTMIQHSRNNPLKFSPDEQGALRTMLVDRPAQFMPLTDSFREGFDDLRTHETAVYAAMQRALLRVIEDIAPETIEARAKGNLFGSRDARAWQIFVERWDAMTKAHENGMLDVFLIYFAETYDAAVRERGGGRQAGMR